MRMDGRRESQNVEDRRGISGGAKAGMGIGGIVSVPSSGKKILD